MLLARCGLLLWTAVVIFGVQAATGFAQTSADASATDALTKLDAYAKDAMAKTKVPGVSVAVVYQDYSKEKPPSDPSPGGAASSFVGTYTNPYYGKVEIEEQQGKLILRLPPLGAYYELSHWDGSTYTYYIANEVSRAARRGVEFCGDGNQLKVENLKFEYSNVFQRAR